MKTLFVMVYVHPSFFCGIFSIFSFFLHFIIRMFFHTYNQVVGTLFLYFFTPSLDQSGQVRTSLDKSGQVWTSLDKSGQVWTNLEKSKLIFYDIQTIMYQNNAGSAGTNLTILQYKGFGDIQGALEAPNLLCSTQGYF